MFIDVKVCFDSVPYFTGGVYINFITEVETNRVSAAYGSSHDRLKKIKQEYDPNNLFRMNQNVKSGK